ncbi:hypothetical protein [Marimonas lutisalis]|uniref:hypothetical protein n=1 Tax=Marimonas lutisalis TaxID=2545756 RepID=UPI00195FE96B|nr:hypothetical protein [Marimonas lutisalis]
MRLAVELANAEASLRQAENALAEFEAGKAEPSEIGKAFQNDEYHVLEALDAFEMSEVEMGKGFKLLHRIRREILEETAIGGQRHKSLRAYVGIARNRRRRAFDAWMAERTSGAE